jgi:predicted dehydrogenase
MYDRNGLTRRAFLKQAGVGIAAAGVAPMFVPSRAFGANDRVNLAIVGVHGRGGSHIGNFGPQKDVRIAKLVDIDLNLLPSRVKGIQQKYGYSPAMEQDFRRVLDDPDIDAVTFAVPNHWHALAAIWAAQAGKHVYVEKPASHSMWEGQQMINASRKYNKLIQVGFQNRSRDNVHQAIELLHGGGIGKVYMARGLCHKWRANIGHYPDGPMQPGEKVMLTIGSPNNDGPYTADYLRKVDYDMWIGPREKRPFNRNRFHYNWHWQWPTGNGDTGNQGPHQLDVGRWGLGKNEDPIRIRSTGGYFAYDNSDQTTPNTQTSVFEYADGTIFEFTTRGLNTNAEGKTDVMIGDIFYGSEGRLEIDGGGNWKTYMGRKDEPGPASKQVAFDPNDLVGGGDSAHFVNFIQSVRSGKQADLNCDIAEGVRSSNLAHMANISYRLGRELRTNGKQTAFLNDTEANAMMKDSYRAPYIVPDLG